MDVRVLKYFLAIAREDNITKAADAVHVTQPALSRRLMDLKDELGAELLVRGKRKVTLTSGGILFQQRAQEIVALLDKAQLDIGILVEPVEIAKYEFIPLSFQDIWGVLMRKDDPLAKRKSLRTQYIVGLLFFMSHRRIVTEEIESWFGKMTNKLNMLGYHNLITNTMLLIERGLCYSITVQGAYSIRPNKNLRFVPLSPARKAGHVMAWKRNRIFGHATSLFLEYVKNTFHA